VVLSTCGFYMAMRAGPSLSVGVANGAQACNLYTVYTQRIHCMHETQETYAMYALYATVHGRQLAQIDGASTSCSAQIDQVKDEAWLKHNRFYPTTAAFSSCASDVREIDRRALA
jgi:hypothetical protein